MKVLKLLFGAVVIMHCLSFTPGYTKPLAETCFYYKSNYDYQRLECDHCSETDLREQSINCDGGATFTDPSSWQTSAVSYTATTDMSKYIGKICFNLDAVNPPNGGADGDLTLQEALDALYNYYSNNCIMPSSLTVGVTVITVQAATAVH
jgi:hypothetical protein